MTYFLPAGIISDRVLDLLEMVCRLEEKLNMAEIDSHPEEIESIKGIVQELVEFIQSFSCQPLIYTGKGTTEEVIDRLEWILTFSDADQIVGTPAKPKRKKRKTSGNT